MHARPSPPRLLARCLWLLLVARAVLPAAADTVWVADSRDTPGSSAADAKHGRYNRVVAEPDCEVIVSDLSLSLGLVENAQFQAPVVPNADASAGLALPSAAGAANRQLSVPFGVTRDNLDRAPARNAVSLTSATSVSGAESAIRSTTDTGDLLGSSPSVLNLGVQRRNPIVTDPRVRGSRVGSLAASGSFWVPARIDLDTVLSKVDSRLVDQVEVVPGPYTTLYGPGFSFIDFQLIRTPRFANGFEAHGVTSATFETNGENWFGRQNISGGDRSWGFVGSYGHATGNDYRAGGGGTVPSSFKTRDAFVALGGDLTDDDSVEFNYLRLDQTDVELPGQAFDIDFLVTDGFEFDIQRRGLAYADQATFEAWYNRTRFEGSAQRAGKRAQFPIYDNTLFVGNTDVDSMSTGYRAYLDWQSESEAVLTAGADLRYVSQELNEITSGVSGFNFWLNANSPVPDSHYSNPGLFGQIAVPLDDSTTLTAGARADWVSTNIDEDLANLEMLGAVSPAFQQSAAEILGSDAFSQDETLGAAFVSGERRLDDYWTAGVSVGYAERAPNLTERYAVQPFMFLLQNGLNTVTGDPELDKERLIQVDARLLHQSRRFRGVVTAHYGWYRDYITFENIGLGTDPTTGEVEQVQLKYVNTDRAEIAGIEALGEYEASHWLTPFATLKFVYGQDKTRDGSFATRPADPLTGTPSEQVTGLPRGSFSGVTGAPEEPLPSILPIDSRIGFRIGPGGIEKPWGVELAARVVGNQRRVASSLLESTTPGFTTYDIRTFWRPGDLLQVVAGVENLTDKRYREHLDFRSLSGSGIPILRSGVNFYVGADLNY